MTPATSSGLDPLEGKALLSVNPPKGARVICCEGAVRSSKTVSTLALWARYVRELPKGKLLMIGVTIDSLIRNILVPLQEWYGTQRVKFTRSLGWAEIFGRRVFIMGANNIAAVKRVQGLTLVGAYVDEAPNLPEEFFNMLNTRLSVPGAKMILTGNPEGPKHWLLQKWLLRSRWHIDAHGNRHLNTEVDAEGEPLSIPWFRVTFVLDDNVWLNRTNPEYVADLKRSHTGVFYQRMILSRWVSADGMVYPDLSVVDEITKAPGRHGITTRELAEYVQIERVLSVGIDYGQNHKTRGYFIGLGRFDVDRAGTPCWRSGLPRHQVRYGVFTLDEFAPGTATVGQHVQEFEQWLKGTAIWGPPEWICTDPAALVLKAELQARGLMNVMGAHNKVLAGIQTISALLASGGLFVVIEKCPKLIDMLPAYVWDSKAEERGETKPLKENDDEADAWRYAIYTVRDAIREYISLVPISESADDGRALVAA